MDEKIEKYLDETLAKLEVGTLPPSNAEIQILLLMRMSERLGAIQGLLETIETNMPSYKQFQL